MNGMPEIKWSDLVKKAQSDPMFRHALMSDPRGTIEREMGTILPDGVDYVIHEQSPARVNLVLPIAPKNDVQSLAVAGLVEATHVGDSTSLADVSLGLLLESLSRPSQTKWRDGSCPLTAQRLLMTSLSWPAVGYFSLLHRFELY